MNSSPFNKLGPSNMSGTSKMKSNPFDSKSPVRTDKNSNKALDRSQQDSYSIDRYNERSTSFGYINPNYIDRNRNKANNSQQSITQSQQQSILSDSDIHAQEFASSQVNISHPTFKQLNSYNDISMREKSMQEKRIKYEYNEQGDTSSSLDYSVDDFVWRLNKEKMQFRKQSEEDSRTQSNKILTNYKNTPSMNSSPDHLRNKNNNFSQQEDQNIENFDNILEKQRRFYNMLARSQTLQSQKSREEDSSSPPSRGLQKNESPTLLNNTRKLSGQSSSMNASPNQTTLRNIDSSPGIREQFMMNASDQSNIENEMVRLNKKLKGYEKKMIEKQEEIDFMKSLLADAQNEVEKIKNQREKDFIMMTEINDRHSKDKKKLQNKLDQTLDKLLTSANVSVNHNISNRVDTSLNVIQALNSVEEEKLSLQNKLDQAYKEIDFQKRSNETLRQRINNLLINQHDSGNKEDSKHKELTCLLKEYLHEIEDLRSTNQKLDFLLKQTKNQYEERNIYLTNQLEDGNKKLKQMEKDMKPFQKDKEKQTMMTAKLKEDLENKDKEYQKEIDALTRKADKLKHDLSIKDKDLQEEIVTLNLKIDSLKEEIEREKKFNKKLSEAKLKGEDNQAIKEVFQDQIDELNLENEELKEKLIEIQNRTNELHRDNTGLKENLIENQKQTEKFRKEIQELKEKLNQSMKYIEELGIENQNLRHNLTEQEKALDVAKSEASKVEIREIPKVEIREVFRDPTRNPADLEKIDQLQIELNEASEALIKLKTENEELSSTKEAYISLRHDYSDLKQQHNAINKEFLDFKSSQAEIQQTLEDKIDTHLDDIAQLQNEVKNLQTEIKHLKVEKDGYVSQLEEMTLIKQSLISNEQALKEAELEKKSLRGDIDNYESRLKKISNDYEAKLKKANQEITNQIEQVKILTSNKNTESVVKELRIQNEKAKEEINKLRKTMDQKISETENECFMQKVQNDQLKAILEDQDIKIKELEEKMKAADSKSKGEIDRAKASAEDYQNRLVLKEDEIKTLNNEIKSLKDRMSEQENKSNDAILTELKEELEQQKAIVEKQKNLMTRQKGDITDLKNKIEDQKLALKDAGADHDQLDAKVREQDHIIDGYAKQIESLIERITELSAKEQEYLQQIRTLKSKSKK